MPFFFFNASVPRLALDAPLPHPAPPPHRALPTLPPVSPSTATATATPTPLALSSAALADHLTGDDVSHTCDGDWVTVAWGGGGGGGGGRHHATAAAAASADPPALAYTAAAAFGGGQMGGVNKSTCYGTFSAHWAKKDKDASGCAKCVGTATILRAPCGAKIIACDGLLHHFGSAPHPGGKVAWHGSGALGVSVMVKSPPRKEQDSTADADSLDRHHGGGGGKNDEPTWHTVARFSSDGMWGESWVLKDGAVTDGPDPATPAFEAAARAALGGVAFPGDAGWTPPNAGTGLLRRGLDALSAVLRLRGASSINGDSSAVTCNGKPINPLLPCAGTYVVQNHPTGGHGHLDGACYGLWSPLHVCKGLATSHVTPEAEDEVEACTEGASASASGCPAHWSLRRQCDGKMGAYPKVGGVGVWCAGRTSGAVLVQEGGGRHRRHQAAVEVV